VREISNVRIKAIQDLYDTAKNYNDKPNKHIRRMIDLEDGMKIKTITGRCRRKDLKESLLGWYIGRILIFMNSCRTKSSEHEENEEKSQTDSII
jgi:hypothetical protein